jgi:hypothetical protein
MLSLNDNFKNLEFEAIRKLASSDMREAADVLPEIAYCFKIAGYTLEDFCEYRNYLIQQAEIISENPNILRMKLEIYEREQREKRNFSTRSAKIRQISH